MQGLLGCSRRKYAMTHYVNFTSAQGAEIVVSYEIEYLAGTAHSTYFANLSCTIEGPMTKESRIRAVLTNRYSVYGNGHETYQHTWKFDLYPGHGPSFSGTLIEPIEVLHHWRDHSIISVPQIAVEINGVWQQDWKTGSHDLSFVWHIR